MSMFCEEKYCHVVLQYAAAKHGLKKEKKHKI